MLLSAFDEYETSAKKDIEDSIKGELSGHFEDLLLAIGKSMSAYKLVLYTSFCQISGSALSSSPD